MALVCKMNEERFNLAGSHIAGVANAVEPYERSRPINVALLGAQAVMAIANPLAQLIEQASRPKRRAGSSFHDALVLYIYTVLGRKSRAE